MKVVKVKRKKEILFFPHTFPHTVKGCYGGYEGNTVYDLFINEKSELLCTLNGEAGEDFDEPIENVQVEGLIILVHWLLEHGFLTSDEARCKGL